MKRNALSEAGVVLFVLASLGACSRGSQSPRLLDFKVDFGETNIPAQMTVGQTATADVIVKNISKNKWPSKANEKGKNAVNLAYHWLDRNGSMVVFDGLRTPLPHDVQPGESVRLKAMIQPPDRAGEYTLEVTLVQELVAWFPERDGGKLTRSINVIKPGVEAVSAIPTGEKAETFNKPDQTKIERRKKKDEPSFVVKNTLPPVEATKEPKRVATDAGKRASAGDTRGPAWTVQLAAVPQRTEAERVVKKLRDKKYDAYIESAVVGGSERYRIRVGRLASRADAIKLQGVLKSQEGFTQSFIASVQ
ncbi:MAG TPA: SPOR domain-containing protein [Terriglobales bacterium]|jgi:cell division septation protein DedD|nr:SPOR domain-containing protein [Terriglobales bacterium]